MNLQARVQPLEGVEVISFVEEEVDEVVDVQETTTTITMAESRVMKVKILTVSLTVIIVRIMAT